MNDLTTFIKSHRNKHDAHDTHTLLGSDIPGLDATYNFNVIRPQFSVVKY